MHFQFAEEMEKQSGDKHDCSAKDKVNIAQQKKYTVNIPA